jgi:hypothetical protein
MARSHSDAHHRLCSTGRNVQKPLVIQSTMKLLLIILAALLLIGSFFADYKWRQWIAARRAQQDRPANGDPSRHSRP